jgi:hypothetical protein
MVSCSYEVVFNNLDLMFINELQEDVDEAPNRGRQSDCGTVGLKA